MLVPEGRTKRRGRLEKNGFTAGRGLKMLALCAITGVLLAGLAFPVVGSLGLVARAGAEQFESIPEDLVEPPLPQSSRILASDGSTLAVAYFNENRVVVPLARIPKVMRDAILAVEDERFYEHNGVDVKGLVRAAVRNSQAGEVMQGGSTITQQYVKNVLIAIESEGGAKRTVAERTIARKVREARMAIALERRYSKDEILEKYLNIAYFGGGVYGVGTAARFYFGKQVEKLTLPEAALLAGIVKNPRLYDPVNNARNARLRRNVVLDRMLDVGAASAKRIATAKRSKVKLKVTRERGIENNEEARYYLDYVRTLVIDDPDGTMAAIFGDTPAERAQKLFQGGLTIRTALDARLQRTALDAMRQTLGEKTDPASSAVVVQPGTGLIKVMAGLNHEKKSRKVNLPLGGKYGFQAGSTFKVFVLAAAIEQGIPLSTRIKSPETYHSKTFLNYVDGRVVPYRVSNAGDSEQGVFDVWRATWDSVNTAYIQLEEKTGLDAPARIARDMGVRSFPVKKVPSLVLGSNEVSPLDMASSYATLAARGLYCKPIAITEVVDANGDVLGRVDPSCRQVMEQHVADTVTAVLSGVLTKGTGKGAQIGRPAAGKTGTTNGPTAAWFDGYTPDLAAAVWVGHVTDPMKRPLRWVKGVPIVYGGGFPATIWRMIMSAAHDGLPVRDFVAPTLSELTAPATTAPRPPSTGPSPAVASPEPLSDTATAAPDDKSLSDRRCRGRKCKN
ncbi:MAG TPA: transglycosylase domain-containing protein [Frankiaceae bacterium]|nr:transglycosylase domain-containing protein [Frankiaceae bacterium]